jgi:membrane protein DedA with SNARE-associated domain
MDVTSLISNYGLIALFLLLFINGFASFFPSELSLFLAGILSFTTDKSFLFVLIVVVLGNLIGTYILYLLGRLFGYNWLLRIKYFSKLTNKDTLFKISEKFKKEGAYWVCIFRCFPVVRSIVSLPAGMIKMPHLVFLVYSTIGITIWALFWMGLGYFFGLNFLIYKGYITLILLILLVILIYFFKRKISTYLNEKNLKINENLALP